MPDWWLLLLMLPIGAFCSAYGTLIGAGGGFLLVPILLFIFPHLSASQVTSISLAMAFFNAVSGSIPYLRLRRVDVRSAIFFATGTIPGAIIGVYIVALLSRNIFDPIFGILLALVGLWTFFNPGSDRAGLDTKAEVIGSHQKGINAWIGPITRQKTERSGITYTWTFNQGVAWVFNLLVGLIASIFGVGGGIISVPALITFFNFPTYIATATSTFTLMITTFSSVVTHIVSGKHGLLGDYAGVWTLKLMVIIGAIIGAQFGARLATKLKGSVIVRLLGGGLTFVGIRLILKLFFP